MDPKLLALIQQKQGAQGQPQGGAEAQPEGGSFGDSRFDSNPFEQIMGDGQEQQGMPMSMPRGAAPSQAPQGQQQPMQPGPNGEMPDSALTEGQNPGGTKPLLVALSALHNYITAASDPSEIATVRSCMALLTRLVASDQQRQGQRDQQMAQGASQPQYPTAQAQQ